jgi:macrolide transport system ATP-binding/permease protein
MVLREVVVLTAIGLSAGLAVALATTRFVGSSLYSLKPNDPTTLALAVVILSTAALIAGYVPARKASRIDPMTALRIE